MSRSADPGSRWRRGRRHVAVAALIGVGVALLTGIGLALDLGAGLRADAVDRAHTSADAHPDVVVVGIDREYIKTLSTGAYRLDTLFRTIVRSRAPTVVNSRDTLEVHAGYIEAGFTPSEARAFAAESIGNLAPERWVNAMYNPPLRPAADGGSLPVLPASTPYTSVPGSSLRAFSDTLGHDGRGVLRTVPLAAATDEDPPRVVPSTAQLVLRRHDDLPAEIEERPGELRIGDRAIPTEGDGELRVSYADELLPGGSQVMSSVGLVEYQASAGLGGDPFWGTKEIPFEGQTVFWGVTDPDVAEMIPTPAGPQPAVIVEANAANTLLNEQYLRPIPGWQLAVAAGALAFVVALATLVLPIWLTPLAPILGGWVWWAATWRLVDRDWLGDPVVGFGAVAAGFVAALGWRAARELRRRREVSSLFSRYVPESVAAELLDTGLVDSVVDGQRLEVTVLFCDLRQFTALSARLDPGDVRALLDRYYEYASQLVLDHRGTLMQYVGDEVFAVWGAPLADADHAQHALDCALAMQAERGRLDQELTAADLPELRFGIGLNSGSVVAAHTGSSIRRQYSVLGDVVNVGSRLCSVAEPDTVVLSDEVRCRLGAPPLLDDAGALDLKGVRADLQAWSVPVERARVPTALR